MMCLLISIAASAISWNSRSTANILVSESDNVFRWYSSRCGISWVRYTLIAASLLRITRSSGIGLNKAFYIAVPIFAKRLGCDIHPVRMNREQIKEHARPIKKNDAIISHLLLKIWRNPVKVCQLHVSIFEEIREGL